MYELRIAMRQVFSRRKQTFFAVLAVTLAVAVITVMMAMLSGFQTELTQSLIENNPHVVINSQHEGNFIHLYKYISTKIAEKRGVVAVSPKYLGPAALKYRNKVEGVTLQGVDPEAEDMVLRVNKNVISGDFLALTHSRYSIVIGDKLAENLGIKLGNRVETVFPGSGTTSFKVVGLTHTGTSLDETTAYARLDSVQHFFNKPGVVSIIGVRIVDPYQADNISSSVKEETGLEAKSWMEANSDILNLLNTQMAFVYIFYILIYGIAGFGIANTLITIVAQRTKEIGILKAMGASQKSIMLIFIFQSIILGAIGLLLGIVLGYISTVMLQSYPIQVPPEMYFGLKTLPLKVDPLNFVYAALFTLIVNIISGIYPAHKATKLDPVKAIESS